MILYERRPVPDEVSRKVENGTAFEFGMVARPERETPEELEASVCGEIKSRGLVVLHSEHLAWEPPAFYAIGGEL